MHYEIEFPLAALSAESVESGALRGGRNGDHVLGPRRRAGARAQARRDPVVERHAGARAVRLADASSIEATQSLGRLAQLLGASHHGVRDACARSRAATGNGCGSKTGSRCVSDGACGYARRRAPAPEDPDAVVVRLDPGLAFGTGTHPTTALCLQMLDAMPLAGRSLIDYGCGSGILGIAALKLGAARVVAVDLDPQALVATRENAVRNGVADRLEIQGVPPCLEPASCVFANILADPLDRARAGVERGLPARGGSVPVRTPEEPGLCGKGRVRRVFCYRASDWARRLVRHPRSEKFLACTRNAPNARRSSS